MYVNEYTRIHLGDNKWVLATNLEMYPGTMAIIPAAHSPKQQGYIFWPVKKILPPPSKIFPCFCGFFAII